MSHNVVLQGRFAADADPAAVKRKFMALTGQTEIVTERLFSGRPTVIKRQLTQADAERIAAALRRIGADASVAEDAPPILELALEYPVPPATARPTPSLDQSHRPAPHDTLSLQEPFRPARHATLSLQEPQQEPQRPAPHATLSLVEPQQEPQRPAPHETLSLQEPFRPAPHDTLSLVEPQQEPHRSVPHDTLSLQAPEGRGAHEGARTEAKDRPTAPAAAAGTENAATLPPLPPPPPLEDMYRAIIGPAHTDFYLRHFMRRDAGGSMLSWNLAAVLAQFFWSLHRKLWRFAVFGLALGLVVATAVGYLFSAAAGVLVAHADPILTRLGSVLAGAAVGMVVGALGNDAYRRRALQLIRETAHISDPARRLASLAARGGTSQSWRWALAATAVLIALGATGVILGVADLQSSAEAATPRTQRIAGSNYLSGRWRCTSQATGKITYWEYTATGGLSYFGENAQENVPLMGPEVPSRWRLADNVLHWTNTWHGSQWSADNAVLDLSREFMHYARTGGESVICARP